MADRSNKEKIQKLTVDAVLSAMIFIMAFTPLGYLKIGVVSITFITIPAVIGAMLNGPVSGAFLGFIFGLTSFLQCFNGDAFASTLFNINPLYYGIMCFVPRILMGLFCGLIFKALSKKCKNSIVNFGVTSLSGGILNTVMFVGALLLFFGRTDIIQQLGETLPAIIAAIVTFNGIIEWFVCLFIGTAVSKALSAFMKRSHLKK